ncbi:MAG: preprotein translocase subunit SecE [Porticoccaceae bacterium]|nr:preprotein translocase subunit SecE [Porticoccaceae bacterium]OUS03735.1 preprotein translocase subunit SecE [Gammaproteobacteria bacterium 54_18_T64]
MIAATDEKTYRFDGVKWSLIAILLGGAIYGNYYFSAEPLLYRVLILILVAVVAGVVILQTAKGADFWALAKGAKVEAGRVVWPTRQERNQTTLVVVAFVLVMAMLLWGLDAFFGWIAAMIIG